MEQIDYFSEEYQFLGQVSIDEIHRKGLWHQTVAFWLYNKEKKIVYLQLRGPKNRVGPNTFDASSGGHLSAGETKEDGIRELKEELGVDVNINNCFYLKMYKNIVHLPHYINNEFCHIYFVKTDKLLADFVLEEGEVLNLFEFPIEKTDSFLSGEEVEINSVTQKRKITLKDMSAFEERIKNNYYHDVFKSLQQIILK